MSAILLRTSYQCPVLTYGIRLPGYADSGERVGESEGARKGSRLACSCQGALLPMVTSRIAYGHVTYRLRSRLVSPTVTSRIAYGDVTYRPRSRL
eukprot:3013059-Rhodomonas_salina.1